PVRWNRRVGVERKSVDTGTARTREPGRLALSAKTRADAAHGLASSLTESDALLDRSCHGAGEFRCGVAQGIIPSGHGGLHARFQIAQPAQLTDDPSTDLLDHRRNVGIGGRLSRDTPGPVTRCRHTEQDRVTAE